MGSLYDNQGDQLSGPFSMSGSPSSLPLIDPALNAMPDGGYSLAYETDLQDGGSHQVTIQLFDANGNAVGSSVSQDYQPTNPLAPPKIAGLEEQLFGSVTVMGIGNSIFAAIVSDPSFLSSSQQTTGQSGLRSTRDSRPVHAEHGSGLRRRRRRDPGRRAGRDVAGRQYRRGLE